MKLSSINRVLEVFGVLLIVGHWEGIGEREPTTLVLMTVREFERRCALRAAKEDSRSEPEEPMRPWHGSGRMEQ